MRVYILIVAVALIVALISFLTTERVAPPSEEVDDRGGPSVSGYSGGNDDPVHGLRPEIERLDRALSEMPLETESPDRRSATSEWDRMRDEGSKRIPGSYAFMLWALTRLEDLTVNDIVNSDELNPRRLPMTNDQLATVRLLVETYAQHVRVVDTAWSEAFNREVDAAVAAGKSFTSDDVTAVQGLVKKHADRLMTKLDQRVDIEKAMDAVLSGRKSLMGLGAVMMGDAKGNVSYVASDELRDASRLATYKLQRSAEFVETLLAWLYSGGFIRYDEYQAMHDDMARRM